MPSRVHLRTSATRPRISPVAACLLTALFFTPARISAQQSPTPPPGVQTANPGPSPWPEIDALAERLAAGIERNNLKLVFVVGNVHPGTGVSDQDIKLRDALSDSLASHLHDSRLIDGAAIRKFLKDNRISPDMLYSPSLADLIAIHGRADAFVALAIRYLDSGLLRLTAELHAKEKNFESVGEFSCEVALSDLQTKVSGNPSSTSLNKTAPYAGTNGLTGIECLYCPGPSFPPKARRKGVKGQVMVLTEVIVNPDGRAYDIRLISSAGFGFDAEAVEAILRWRFKPAQVGGQPIAAITQIQILFQ